ncbi:MAG: hypothetical protein ABR508_02900 [Candidatus Baltobacteraceae bacterium]
MKLLRLLAPAAALAVLSACGGGGGSLFGGGSNGSNGLACDTGTSEQLASPQPGTYAPGTSTITIVANGSNNQLYNSYQNWYVYLTNVNTGQTVTGGQLNLTSDRGGPQPYGSDFYYSSALQQQLPSGGTWNVFLTEFSGNCNAVPLLGFTT